jgi:hypothetical protein
MFDKDEKKLKEIQNHNFSLFKNSICNLERKFLNYILRLYENLKNFRDEI